MGHMEAVSMSSDNGGKNALDATMHPLKGIYGEQLYIFKNSKYNKIESIGQLKNTTLLVVVDNEQSAIGKALHKAFSTYWKFNNYKFITRNEVFNYVGKKEYSFFMYVRDEHYMAGGFDRGNLYGPPHFFYKSDAMQHDPNKSHWGNGEFGSRYLFLICINNGNRVTDTTEDEIMANMSAADYIVPYPDNDYFYSNAGLLLAREQDAIPEFDTIVSNFQNDVDYVAKNKAEYVEKEGIPQSVKCNLLYNGQKNELKINLFTFDGNLKKLIKNKTVYINNGITDELGRGIITQLTGLDENNVKLVPDALLDSIIKSGNEDAFVLKDLTIDKYGGYKIKNTSGEEEVSIPTKYSNNALGTFDLLGTDAWSDRKKVTVITK
jgi:hypothetical protein